MKSHQTSLNVPKTLHNSHSRGIEQTVNTWAADSADRAIWCVPVAEPKKLITWIFSMYYAILPFGRFRHTAFTDEVLDNTK